MSVLGSLVYYFGTNFKWAWDLINKSRAVRRWLSKITINNAIGNGPKRPNPLSLLADYTSWESLTDRTYTGRHLPPIKRAPAELPDIDRVARLFAYRDGRWKRSQKSTLLFSYFAQWFTDGFLRTDRESPLRKKNTSNHEIDLSPLYGLGKEETDIVRSQEFGRLRSQTIKGEEYPLYLYADGGVKPEFEDLNMFVPEWVAMPLRATLFAMGGNRANIQIGYVMLNVLFLREHNRVANTLAEAHPDWDDERLFQTARNVVIVEVIKLVIEEYINHLSPFHLKLIADPTSFYKEAWYRQNWMTVEFNLLYRWHSLTPPKISLDGKETAIDVTMFNNGLITARGLGALIEEASTQPCGELGLHNTMDFLIERAEKPSIQQAREAELASFNDYREMSQLSRLTSFAQITKDVELQKELSELYEHDIDRVEFIVGLFAEDNPRNSVTSELMGRMVAFDAFSQALTNPLLAERVYNETTFSPEGMEIIRSTTSLFDVVHRNIPDTGKTFKVSLTRLDI